MHASLFDRVALAAAVSTVFATAALAGGIGHGGGDFRPAGGGIQGAAGGHGSRGGPRGMPPVAGVIHERSGMRPYLSIYGHTATGARYGGFARGAAIYGHTATAPRYGAERGYGSFGQVRRRFPARRRYAGFVGGGYGGFGGGFGDGTYGAPGVYGDAGVYGGQGTYGQPGTYGGAGSYATQSVYGTGAGTAYRSEEPLAVRFAEPPLAPSPYAPYSPNDRYAYAASADVGPGPRVVNPYRAAGSDCACGGRRQPVVYRYGVGTAY